MSETEGKEEESDERSQQLQQPKENETESSAATAAPESEGDFDEFQAAVGKKSREQVLAELQDLISIPGELPPLPDFAQYMGEVKGWVQAIYERYPPGSRLKLAKSQSKGLGHLKDQLRGWQVTAADSALPAPESRQ